jgi:hypothetical protein
VKKLPAPFTAPQDSQVFWTWEGIQIMTTCIWRRKMKWELDALKLLAKNPTVPGIALQDAIGEIERLQKSLDGLTEPCHELVLYRNRQSVLSFQLEKADDFIREISNALQRINRK